MSTLKKLCDACKVKIGGCESTESALLAICEKFMDAEGERIVFAPMAEAAKAEGAAFFGEALPKGYDAYLVKIDAGVTVYYTSEISRVYALYEILKNYDGGIGKGMIYGRAVMQVRGYKTYLPPKDKIEDYKRLMDLLLYLGYNTLTIELVGAAEYKSHPEINRGWEELCAYFAEENGRTNQMQRSFIYPKDSIHVESGGGKVLSVSELAEIRDYAYARGIEIIPEMPCLSHAEYLLYNHPEFAEVAEDHFPEVCCPSNPDYYKMLFEIFDDMIEIFRPKRINVGHDELYVLGRCPRCKGKKAADLLLGDITKIHDFLASRGVKTMLWGDKVSKAWHGGNPAFHVRLPRKNGETLTYKGKVYERHNFMCRSTEEFLEYAKENPHVEAWYVEETASCIPHLPSDLQISNWSYGEGEMHEDLHSSLGFTTIFGNCSPARMKGIRRRCTKKGIEGFSISNWGNVDLISTQREGHLLNLFHGARVAFAKDYDETMRESYRAEDVAEMFALVNKETLAKPHILIDHACDFVIEHHSFDCGFRIIREDFHIGDYEITYTNGTKEIFPVIWGENIGPANTGEGSPDAPLTSGMTCIEPIGTALPVIGEGSVSYRIAIPTSGEVENICFIKNEKCKGNVTFKVAKNKNGTKQGNLQR